MGTENERAKRIPYKKELVSGILMIERRARRHTVTKQTSE